MTAIACTLLSGLMFYLSQGPADIWWLTLIAPVPLLWLAYKSIPGWHLFLAVTAAQIAGQTFMLQIYGPSGGAGFAFSLFLSFTVFSIGAGGIFRLVAAAKTRMPQLALLFYFPVLWTSYEYLIGLVSRDGSFGSIAYPLTDFPPAIQIASLFGLYVVTFCSCLFANALALALRAPTRRVSVLGFAICAAWICFGYAKLAERQGHTTQVATLADWDARLRSTRKLDRAESESMVEEYAKAAGAQVDKGARLIVMPETALAFDPAWRGQITKGFEDLARTRHVTLVIGAIGVKPWRNVALSFLPDGSVHEYDKRHLLPPFESQFTPGKSPGLLGTGQAVSICKDLDFPRTMRSDALAAGEEQGIQVMVVPANDFGRDGWIHARMAILRGVENGFAVVRSAFNGLETVSDAQGRVLARTDTEQRGLVSLTATLPAGSGLTFYTRIGDLFDWLALVAAGALTATMLARRQGRGS